MGIDHRLHRGDDAPRDLGDGAIAVDRDETTVVIEPLEQRPRLVLEDVESLTDHVGVVIGTTREHGAAVIAQRAPLIATDRSSALGAHEARAESFGRLALGHHQLDHRIETVRGEQRVERDGLIDRAWEAVEHESVARDVLGLESPSEGHEHEVVGSELSGIDVFLSPASDG